MPFCGTCGAQVEGRFCAKCGNAVGTSQPPSGQPGPAPAGAAGAPMADNVVSALCYVLGLVTGIIFLVIAPYNQNRVVRFHAFQAIFMHVGVIICYILVGVVFSMLPIGGLYLLWPLIWLGAFCLWIFMMVSAYQGKQVELPVIGPFARQQAGTN